MVEGTKLPSPLTLISVLLLKINFIMKISGILTPTVPTFAPKVSRGFLHNLMQKSQRKELALGISSFVHLYMSVYGQNV